MYNNQQQQQHCRVHCALSSTASFLVTHLVHKNRCMHVCVHLQLVGHSLLCEHLHHSGWELGRSRACYPPAALLACSEPLPSVAGLRGSKHIDNKFQTVSDSKQLVPGLLHCRQLLLQYPLLMVAGLQQMCLSITC